MGKKSREARALIYRLASQGWVCISANYRLRAPARSPEQLIDVKKLLAWVREHGHEYGADPAVVFVAGSSAGAHLAALAALTSNQPAFQPGFEGADTSMTAAICPVRILRTPRHRRTAPLVAPGVRRNQRAALLRGARRSRHARACQRRPQVVERLRGISSSPVVYAELPGAQHSFDLFHSIRFETVVDAIEAFAAWVRSRVVREADRHEQGSTRDPSSACHIGTTTVRVEAFVDHPTSWQSAAVYS
jgi:acetyl esterase/lipase